MDKKNKKKIKNFKKEKEIKRWNNTRIPEYRKELRLICKSHNKLQLFRFPTSLVWKSGFTSKPSIPVLWSRNSRIDDWNKYQS